MEIQKIYSNLVILNAYTPREIVEIIIQSLDLDVSSREAICERIYTDLRSVTGAVVGTDNYFKASEDSQRFFDIWVKDIDMLKPKRLP